QVVLGRPTGHEKKDHPLGPGRVLRRAGAQRARRLSLVGEHRIEGQSPEPAGSPSQECAATDRAEKGEMWLHGTPAWGAFKRTLQPKQKLVTGEQGVAEAGPGLVGLVRSMERVEEVEGLSGFFVVRRAV